MEGTASSIQGCKQSQLLIWRPGSKYLSPGDPPAGSCEDKMLCSVRKETMLSRYGADRVTL